MKLTKVAGMVMSAALVLAQVPQVGPRFEVTSVKAIREGQVSLCGDDGGNQIPCTNVVPHNVDSERFRAVSPLHGPMGVIEWAYGVREFQVSGAPEWLARESFEIQAVNRPVSDTVMKQMVQGLLADRFQMKAHRQRGEVPVYALVVGKNGPKLTEAKNPPGQGPGDIEIRPGLMVSFGGTMSLLAHILSDNLERPVVDKTGLTGHYDFRLTFEPGSTASGFAPIGAAIFGPIQDLGLRLEPGKQAFEMLVIDSIGHPSEN